MFTPPWYAAVVSQVGIAILACIVATRCLEISWRTALPVTLIFNSIPIIRAPGFETPLFIHDFLTPVFAFLVLSRWRNMPRGLFGLAVLTILIWPIVGIINSIAMGVSGYKWLTLLYRRLGFLSFLLAGACAFSKTRPRDVTDTYVVIWIGMSVMGMAQYFDILNVDFLLTNVDAGASILEDAAAQHGFLGLPRPAVGCYGAVMMTYCVAYLMFERHLHTSRLVLYSLGAVLSLTVVLFAGSRTGLSASLVGVTYVSVTAFKRVGTPGLGRLMLLAATGAAAVFYLLAPAANVVGQRLQVENARHSFETRVEAQEQVLSYAIKDPAAAVIGMGNDPRQFRDYLNATLTHAHSEYLQVLWSSGYVGLALYLLLLYRLYSGMGAARVGGRPDLLGIAARGMFVAGLVTGVADGNLLVEASWLATFGMAMLFAYGLVYGDAQRRGAWLRAGRRWGPPRALRYRRATVPLQPTS